MPESNETEVLDYIKTAPILTEHLEKLSSYARELALKASSGPIEEILKRLRQHRFTVAVLGEFKTGKSTLVNALLAVDVLPTDVIPATATLNRIRYGVDRRIEAIYRDGRPPVPVPFDKLSEYVTKEFVTPQMLSELEEVVVYCNAPFLMNNVDIIDTPGLNDDHEMTNVTLGVLPKIDAAILVISALTPLSDFTRRFLEERLLSADLGRVLFVVNRIGQMGSPEEVDRVIAHVEKRIEKNVIERAKGDLGEDSKAFADYRQKIGRPRVYGMDSAAALKGQLTNEGRILAQSRYPAFQQALRDFLNNDRGEILLQVPVNRAMAASSEILMKIRLFQDTASMRLDEFQIKRDKAFAEMQAMRARKDREIAELERTAAQAVENTKRLLTGVEQRVWWGVRQAVERADLTDEQAKNDKEGKRIIQGVAQSELKRIAEREVEAAAQEINRNATRATDQIQRFAAALESMLNRIALDFSTGSNRSSEIGVAAAGGIVSIFTIAGAGAFYSGYSGYKQAGIAGAMTGIATTVGATAALTYAALAVGMTVSLPLVLGASIIAFFAGDSLTKLVFKGERAKTFKEKALEQIEHEITKLNLEVELGEKVTAYAAETFEKLKQNVARDVDALLDDMSNTLNTINEQKMRDQTVAEETLKRYASISTEVAEIQAHATRLNQILLLRSAAGAA